MPPPKRSGFAKKAHLFHFRRPRNRRILPPRMSLQIDEQRAAFTRVPPHSQEAEESVLGALLTDSYAFDRIADLVHSEDFYIERNARIFAAVTSLQGQARPADVITVTEALKQTGELQRVGGTAYLVELAEKVVTAANIAHYAKLIHDKAILRRLIRTSTEILAGAYESRGQTRDFLDRAETAIFELSSDHTGAALRRIDSLIASTVERIELLFERKSEITGVPTGYVDLDHKTAGLQPSDLIIVAGRPSMGKCLTAESEIVQADGSVRRLEDIVQSGDGSLLTLNDRWRLEPAKPSNFVDDGVKPVFEVTTRLGRRVRTTLSHPFLTIEGWKPLAELEPGETVAVPRSMPVFGSESIGEPRVKLLGYLLGDGSISGTCVRFTNTNPRLQDDFAEAAMSFGGLAVAEEDNPRRARPCSLSGAAVAMDEQVLQSSDPSLMRWLDSLGLRGATAHTKFVPKLVFRLKQEEIALFLNRLFATDGWATVLASGQSQLGYATVSERMARQVQHLLLRFGIVAGLRRRKAGPQNFAWQLDITERGSIETFLDRIGIFGKEAAVERVRRAVATRREKAFRDTVPAAVWKLIETAAAKSDGSWRRSLPGSNLHAGRALSRRRLRAIADALDDANLRDIASSDVYWDSIVSIEPLGMAQVYDLTVDGTHNFVADDVCVHNTAFCLNIAEYAAGECNIGVAVFSMEMSSDQLVMRMICSQAEIDNARVRTGRLHDLDIKRIALTAGKLGGAPIYIDDTPAQTVLEIRAKARRLKHDPSANLGLIIIDYLQLMRGAGEDSREQEISAISRSLKALAKELSVPIIALSQLNRQVELRADKRPGMADLRESGALEQDADVIVFLYRDEQYNAETPEPGVAEIIIAKQRNGPTGTVRLMFDKPYARFRNLTSREDPGAAYGSYE
jgi:replicative DNA helicase